MEKWRCTETQIVGILKQTEADTPGLRSRVVNMV